MNYWKVSHLLSKKICFATLNAFYFRKLNQPKFNSLLSLNQQQKWFGVLKFLLQIKTLATLYNFRVNHIKFMMIFIKINLIHFNKKNFNHKFRWLISIKFYKRKIKMIKIIRSSYKLICLKIFWCSNKLMFKQIKKGMFIGQLIACWVGFFL